MAFLYQLLFTLAGLALKHYAPAGIDPAAVKAELEKILKGAEGPNIPKWLEPVQDWAIGFAVDSALTFLNSTGVLKKLEGAAGTLGS